MTPHRLVMFENFIRKTQCDPVDKMVTNTHNDVKAQKSVTREIIINPEAAKLDAKKILTQEITLTSKAPLKILEMLEVASENGNVDAGLITEVCKYLKNKGKELDSGNYKDGLNFYFKTLRNLSRDLTLDTASRTKLLEVIELRARKWEITDEHAAYYETKKLPLSSSVTRVNQPDPVNLTTSTSSPSIIPSNQTAISPEVSDAVELSSSSGDLIKHSGKFQKPVKVPGKNLVKDEFVIKNSDSGKVTSGIKDRLLRITGPDESSINKAKYYIEDTIKRNASPIHCDQQSQPVPLNQSRKVTSASSPVVNKLLSSDDSSTPFMQSISIGDEVIIIASSAPKLAYEAKSVIEEHFERKLRSNNSHQPSESSDSDISVIQHRPVISSNGNLIKTIQNDDWNNSGSSSTQKTDESSSENKYQKSASHGSLAYGNSVISKDKNNHSNSGKIVYDRAFLIKCRQNAICKIAPTDVKTVTQEIPDIARKFRQMRANSLESGVA